MRINQAGIQVKRKIAKSAKLQQKYGFVFKKNFCKTVKYNLCSTHTTELHYLLANDFEQYGFETNVFISTCFINFNWFVPLPQINQQAISHFFRKENVFKWLFHKEVVFEQP